MHTHNIIYIHTELQRACKNRPHKNYELVLLFTLKMFELRKIFILLLIYYTYYKYCSIKNFISNFHRQYDYG